MLLRPRILIIEGHPVMFETVREVLEEVGADFVLVRTGEEALAALPAYLPQYLICDLHLSRKPDCSDLVRRARELGLTKTKLIAYTVNMDGESESIAREAGFGEVWNKTELEDRIRALPLEEEPDSVPPKASSGFED